MEWRSNGFVVVPNTPALNTPSLQFYSFLFVPFEHDAVDYSAVRSVILNKVKDLSSENSGSWTLHLL